MKNNEVILHGECMLFPTQIKLNALKPIKSKATYMIVADSETTGNHHVVDIVDGVEFFEDEKKTLFMHSSVETQIRCLHKERHDTIKIAPGTYEFGIQQEYDPFSARMQKVAD